MSSFSKKISDNEFEMTLSQEGQEYPQGVQIKRGNKIGSGGFSKVYEIAIHPLIGASSSIPVNGDSKDILAQNESKESEISIPGALKYVSAVDSFGLESLMEIYIMRYIRHPCINHAMGVKIESNGSINIIQPLAIGDAGTLVRKRKIALPPTILARWIWETVAGVAQLHRRGILHGDIKAGNILVFGPPLPENGADLPQALNETHVKLNDFSLSRLIPDPSQGTRDFSRHTSYTSTHRPIEVWKGNPYSLSADIWALGCSVYELAYGRCLFLDQKTVPKNLEVEANLLIFEEWYQREFIPPLSERSPNIEPLPCGCSAPTPSFLSESKPLLNHRRYNLSPQWENPENRLLNDLIMGMLNINPNARLTIWDIIDHDYFEPLRRDPEMLRLLPPPEDRQFLRIVYPYDGVSSSIIDEVMKLVKDSNVIQLAISLYQRSCALSSVNIPSLRACIIIANKLIYRGPPRQISKVPLAEEIGVCSQLNFKFLPHSPVSEPGLLSPT